MKTISSNSGIFRTEFKLTVFIFLFCCIVAKAQVSGDYQTAHSGNWNSHATWQTWNGSGWVPASNAPPANDGSITITIRDKDAVTVTGSSATIGKTIIQTGGRLTITSGTTMRFVASVTGNKLTVNGALVNDGTIVFSGLSVVNTGGVFSNASTGTLTFSGSSLQLSVSGVFNNASSNVTSSTADRLSFNSGSIYEHNFPTVGGVIPTATWNTGSTCRVLGYTTTTTAVPLNSNQRFYNFEWDTPNFVSNSPAMVLLGTVNGNLSVNNTGSGSLTILSLSVVGKNFSTSAASRVKIDQLNFQTGGNVSFAVGSIISSDGVSLTLNGTADQSVDTNGLTFNTVTINNPSHVILLSSTMKVAGSLSITSTGTTLNSNGHLKLLSTSDIGFGSDASIGVIPAGSSITGSVEVDRYMSDRGNIYRYISAPVSNFTVSNFQLDVPVYGNFSGASHCTGGCAASLYYYSASAGSYNVFPKAPQTSSAIFDKGRGYSVYVKQSALSGPVTIHWSGTVNQGTIDLPVSYHSSTPNASWNLVGNPYPSTVNWSNDGTGWSKSNIAQAIAVRDNSNGTFQYFPDDVGNETFNIGQIAKGQAFWVRATGPNPALQIKESAKVSDVATFYRTATIPGSTDRIVLSVSNGVNTDRAYFKVIDDASLAMDYYDAPKMTNVGDRTLNLSTVIPGGSLMMAINAVDKVSCSDTIKLKITGASAQPLPLGSYSFSLNATGIMNNYSWLLYDKYLNTTTDIGNAAYNFAVTTDATSKSENRFLLIVGKRSLQLGLPIAGTKQLCSDGSGFVKINNTQDQVAYTLEINGTRTTTMTGNGSDVSFNLSSDILVDGKNTVKIMASTGCAEGYLSDGLEVMKLAYYVPQIQSKSQCQSGSVLLQASGVPEGNSVRWYASPQSTEVLGTQATFSTPVLTKSKTYYAAGVNAAGCESERVAVTATIIAFDPASITINGTVLQSNYADGNQWYFNNQPVDGATASYIDVKENGTYAVTVNIPGGCTTTASQDVANVASAIEQKLERTVVVYPNPVSQTPLHIEVPETASSVTLLNDMGVALNIITMADTQEDVKKIDVALNDYPVGIYFVQVKDSGTITTVKIAKN